MTMWVFRLSPEDGFTDPAQMRHHEQFFKKSTHPNPRQYANCNFTPAKPGECRTWVINEIFNQQKLRQGWCGIDLDLNLPEEIWISNYRLIDPGNSPLKDIKIQLQILKGLLDIRSGDTIFLPRVGDNQLSYDHFTVVTAAGNYEFENRRDIIYWRTDFGHIIPIKSNLTRTFRYGSETLNARVFAAPFIAKVVRVPNSAFRGFDKFLLNQNYPFNPY